MGGILSQCLERLLSLAFGTHPVQGNEHRCAITAHLQLRIKHSIQVQYTAPALGAAIETVGNSFIQIFQGNRRIVGHFGPGSNRNNVTI